MFVCKEERGKEGYRKGAIQIIKNIIYDNKEMG